MRSLALTVLDGTFAIASLSASDPVPDWAMTLSPCSITRTDDELSIVCSQDRVPGDVPCEAGWRCLRVAGKLDFSMVGVIASLTAVLAEEHISVFVVSTFDTDYVLVKDVDLATAAGVLEAAGHRIVRP